MKYREKSPILVLTHKRPEHLSKVIEALKRDPLSLYTPLYIFIDRIKEGSSQDDEDKQNAVVEIAKSTTGFLSLQVEISTRNLGVMQAVLWSTNLLLQTYDRFIYLEEDIIPDDRFLEYMNRSLDYYRDRNDIYAVNGFSFFEIQDMLESHILYGFSRFCPWGFGTWKDKWMNIDWNLKKIRWKKFSPWFWFRFNQSSWGWGWTFFIYVFFPPLRKKIQPWDILFFLHHYLHEHISIWNKKSYVFNGGWDGSGLHAAVPFQQPSVESLSKKAETGCFSMEITVNSNLDVSIAKKLIPFFRKKTFDTGKKLWNKIFYE